MFRVLQLHLESLQAAGSQDRELEDLLPFSSASFTHNLVKIKNFLHQEPREVMEI